MESKIEMGKEKNVWKAERKRVCGSKKKKEREKQIGKTKEVLRRIGENVK